MKCSSHVVNRFHTKIWIQKSDSRFSHHPELMYYVIILQQRMMWLSWSQCNDIIPTIIDCNLELNAIEGEKKKLPSTSWFLLGYLTTAWEMKLEQVINIVTHCIWFFPQPIEQGCFSPSHRWDSWGSGYHCLRGKTKTWPSQQCTSEGVCNKLTKDFRLGTY